MRHPASRYGSSISFGPGPLSPALKGLIGANVALFVLQLIAPTLTDLLGLEPLAVVQRFQVWRLGSYMFLHARGFPILFNMLALLMFGTQLERTLGTRYFLKFSLLTRIGPGGFTD